MSTTTSNHSGLHNPDPLMLIQHRECAERIYNSLEEYGALGLIRQREKLTRLFIEYLLKCGGPRPESGQLPWNATEMYELYLSIWMILTDALRMQLVEAGLEAPEDWWSI